MIRLLNRRVDLRDETGFGLVEVMVTAVVVVLIATATVSSIGSSQKTSARTLARGITANLAEQDQERMRAMRATDLADYIATRVVDQQGVSYNVDSKAEFVQDPNGAAISCTSTGTQSQSMRLETTVTPQASLEADPLTIRSIYALPITQYSPTSGTLIVKIFRADGITPLPATTVNISGPEAKSRQTNAAGCAVFQFLDPGAYTITVNRTGYVNQALDQSVSFSGTVSAGTINQATPLIYDLAGSLTATFDGTTSSVTGGKITVGNSGIPTPGTATFPTRTATGLFPFTGPYLVYSGNCSANNPTLYEPTFYTTNPTYGKATVPPGGSVGVNVHEPVINTAIKVKTTSTTTTAIANLPVYVAQSDAGCGLPVYTTTTTSTGTLNGARYPYGNYYICVEYTKTNGTSTTNGVYSAIDLAAPNTKFAGSDLQTITIDSTNTANKRTCTSYL